MPVYTVQGNTPEYRKVYSTKEKTTGVFSFSLKDEDGVAIGSGSLSTATLTLYEPKLGTIINSRNAQNILNANNVTIDGAGVVTWTQQVADMTIQTDANAIETHRALFRFTWGGGARGKSYEVDFEIENLGKLT